MYLPKVYKNPIGRTTLLSNEEDSIAKLIQHYDGLCIRIDQLQLNIQTLQYSIIDFGHIVENIKVKAARARLDVLEKLFDFGQSNSSFTCLHKKTQFTKFMKENVNAVWNGSTVGRYLFARQTKLFDRLYPNTKFEMVNVDVCGLTFDIVHVTLKLHLRLNRISLEVLYPNWKVHPMEGLIGTWMMVELYQVYYFDGHFIQRIDTTCDWVNAWRRICTSASDVHYMMKNANIDEHLQLHLTNTQIATIFNM